jgi:hypothetical protein
VDEAHIIAAAIAAMEAPHLQVLAALGRRREEMLPEATFDKGLGKLALSKSDLARSLPGHEAVLEPILQVLAAHGLIEVIVDDDFYVGYSRHGRFSVPAWMITRFGRDCLEQIEWATF